MPKKRNTPTLLTNEPHSRIANVGPTAYASPWSGLATAVKAVNIEDCENNKSRKISTKESKHMERMFFIALTTCMSFSEYGDPPAPRPQHTHIYTHIQRMRAPHIMFVIRKHGANFVCVLCMRQWHMPSMLYVAHEKKLLLLFHHMQSNGSRGGGGEVYTILVGKKREKSQGNNRGTVVLSQPLIMRPGQVHGYLFSFLLRKLETSTPQIGSACRTKAAPSCRQGVSFSALSKKRMRHKGLLTILSETRFELAKGGASNPRFSRAFLFSFSSLACFVASE